MEYRYFTVNSWDQMYSVTTKLSAPNPDEICGMTQEPISTYNLEFTEGVTIIPDHPEMVKITLPCSHSFAAVACLYHFCRNQMRCPLCRQGVDTRMDLLSIPEHMQPSFIMQLNKATMEDRMAEEQENYQDAVTIMLEGIQDNSAVFTQHNTVILVAYCYENSEGLVPLVSFDYELRVDSQLNEIGFFLPNHAMRALSLQLSMVRPLHILEFAIGMRSSQRDFVFIDRTPKIDLMDSDGNISCDGRDGACFTIYCDNRVNCSIVEFKWWSSVQNFAAIIQRQRAFLLNSY